MSQGRRRAIPLSLAACSLLLALVQSPGAVSFDTKVHLHVEPVSFLSDVTSAWSPTADLGHVQSGQYSGYLFPMGPFFALGHELGMADWVVQRLWLGLLLALSAWGVVRLLDALADRPRGMVHLVAGAAYVVNPYVVTFANRTSVTLLAYAALPWMLLAVHRGLRAPRSWWWPGVFALVAATGGGGVNAAVMAWTLVGPTLLWLYELGCGGISWPAARAFAWRTVLLSLLASLWWIGPVLVGNSYGVNFLKFIEQPGTIWGTTSVSEALRLMGYWISYTGVGFAGRPLPLLESAPTMLFSRPVVVASLLVPALSLGGFAYTRRWRYGPFFLALTLVGVLIVVAGFPEGTPFRSGLHFTYNRVSAVQFLRTSYKGAPLIALGLSALLGAGLVALAENLTGRTPHALALVARRRHRPLLGSPRRAAVALRIAGWRGRSPLLASPRLAFVVLGAVAAVMLAVAAWPLASGRALGLTSAGVPAAWRAAARDLDRQLAPNSRAVVLPGQLFSFYRWGGTVDPILPVLSSRPVAQRSVTPYADLHSADLLWTIDALVAQQRLYPGQLAPLLSLIGARSVFAGTDDDRLRSGSPDPVVAATMLAGQGLGPSARAYGPLRRFQSPPRELYPTTTLPEVRRYDLPRARGLVRVEPMGQPLIVDGSADALAGLAAFGALTLRGPVLYAGDLAPAALRSAAAAGADVVVSDSNRRRVFVNSRPGQNLGPTVGAQDSFSADASVLDPFPSAGSEGQTVQVLGGVRDISSPYSPGFSQFPEHRPYAAFDGSTSTAWIADRSLAPARRYVQVTFSAPRDVPYIDLMPEDDQRGTVRSVGVGARRFSVRPGWNHLALGLRHISSLRVLIAAVRIPRRLNGGAGGLREVRIPGLRVTEALRPPLLAVHALAAINSGRDQLTYLFSRTTGDNPLQRSNGHGPWQGESTLDGADGETGLQREITLPAARRFSADAWLSLSPLAPDDTLDRLAGYHGSVRVTSSGRFDNLGRYRASSAFDGSPVSAWVGEHAPGARAWIAWSLPHAVTVRRLRLTEPALPVRVPARVRLQWDGGVSPPLAVARDGSVTLPAAARSRSYTLVVLATRLPAGRPHDALKRRAVGIGEILGSGVAPLAIPRSGPLRTSCGIARFSVGARRFALAVKATVATLDAGGAFAARQCSPAQLLPGGAQLLSAPGNGYFRVDWLRLGSPAPVPVALPAVGSGRVLDPGTLQRTTVTGVRLALTQPSWLVLGESYDRGWRASCDGRSLGASVVIDGYANGWPAPVDCRAASFSFAPQAPLAWLYLFSGLACLGLVVLLLARRRPSPAAAPLGPLGDVARARWPARRAAMAGLAAGAVLGFLFSIRSGVLIAPAVSLILWRGIAPRTLATLAGILLGAVVPMLYLLVAHRNHGGFDFNYPIDLIAAHWVAVGALVALTVALALTLKEARASASARA